jgi:hypothetical protein
MESKRRSMAVIAACIDTTGLAILAVLHGRRMDGAFEQAKFERLCQRGCPSRARWIARGHLKDHRFFAADPKVASARRLMMPSMRLSPPHP